MRYLHLCAHEQFPPEQLLRQGVVAEAAGFSGADPLDAIDVYRGLGVAAPARLRLKCSDRRW